MELDLRDYIKVLKKRLVLILALVVISCAVTASVSMFLLKPIYQASTKLIVNKSNERAGVDQVDINTVNLNLRLIDTYKEVIKTPRIMDKVSEQYPDFHLTSDQLINKVTVSSVNNTQVMTLVVEDTSYEKAARIVNAVSKVFQQEIPSIMKVDNVSLLNEADVNDHPKPVKPNVKLNIAISVVVALMVGVGIAFLLEYLDDTIKTEEDVTQFLELPTLGMIMKIKPEDLNGKHSHKQAGELQRVQSSQQKTHNYS
jgi:capsular polysaccharide biosynthesis protein